MIRTALYIRVSTEEQAIHGLSLEAQDAVLTDYAKKNDLVIVGRYIDEGISARKTMSKRKELMRLLTDVTAGKLDLILITKIDRWTRNIRDFYMAQDILDANNVTWRTVLESYGTTDATSRLHLNIMLSISQDEADRTSERIKVVFENKVKNKEYLTNKTPFGYSVKDSKVFKTEEVKHIVDDMFRKFFDCHSIRGTQMYIQETYGLAFEEVSFRKIFKNTLYCGEYRGVTEFCEPYITRDQFDEIQRIMAEKNVKITPSGLEYVFTGILICPLCGRRLSSRYNTYGPGRTLKRQTYRCPSRAKNNRCDFKLTIEERQVEAYLFKHLSEELDKYKEQYEFRVAEKKKEKKSGTAEKNAEKIRKKLAKLKDLYVNDLIDLETYKKDYDDLNKQLADILVVKEEEEVPVDVDAIKNLLSKSTEEIYGTMTAENRRKFWRSFIDKIVVHSREKMDIIFLTTGGTK